jgi:DNA adenine methylase
MIRFNKKGKFNVPFCRKPNRFAPAYITKICNQIQMIAEVCSYGKYRFICQNFPETVAIAEDSDVIYCDPPYIGRHVDYFNGWNEVDEQSLKSALDSSSAKFILSTWHSNEFRENVFLKTVWAEFHFLTREHYYHVGAKEKNRNPMTEALVTNFKASYIEPVVKKREQLRLFE